MPEGYYRTSPEHARARTARIAERRRVAATPEGKRAIAKRLAAKKATARAKMTPQERALADRREIEAFTAKRVAGASRARPPVPASPVRIPGLVEKMLGGAIKKRTDLLDALGKKKK